MISLVGLASALAQVGAIAGTVKDSSGAVLPGARVQVEQGPSGVSDAQGQFLIGNVSPGSHKITVSYVGFSPSTALSLSLPGRSLTSTLC
jgi:hypothetical protein